MPRLCCINSERSLEVKIYHTVVVGYAGDIYHAWISVYVEEKKMTAICGNRSYDSEHWMRMDPT